MENFIYTLKAKAIIDITQKQQSFTDHFEGESIILPTEFKIDLTNPYHELNIVESFENAGDCAFFDQFRKVVSEQQKKNLINNEQYLLEDNKYLLKDKVVVMDLENLFFQIDLKESLQNRMRSNNIRGWEYWEEPDLTFSQLVRHFISFSNLSIAFRKDADNNPVFHRFMAFDKSQSMARNSRILFVATDFLSPLFSDKCSVYSLNLSEKESLDSDSLNAELDKLQTCEGANAAPKIFDFDGRLDIIPIDYYLPEILKFRNNRENKNDIICVKLPDNPDKTETYIEAYSESFSTPRNVLKSVDEDNNTKEYNTFYPLIENKKSTQLYYIDESTWFSISGKDCEEKTETLRKEYAEYQKLYIDKRLNLGIDFYGINLTLSKFYAYRGLYLSTSKRISGFKEFNQDTVIIVPNKPNSNLHNYNFGEEGLNFDRDYYYQEEVLCCTNTYETDKGRIKAELKEDNILLENDTMFDGEGMICPEYADFIGKQLGKDNVNSFQIRMPFMKGVLHKIDFRGFLKDKTILSGYDGEYEITDYFGMTRDLSKARIILTESMFKAAKWLEKLWKQDPTFHTNTEYDDPMEFYFERFHEYGYSLYISGTDDSYRHGSLTALNYQILNTLAIEKNELKQLAYMHWTHVLSPLDSLLNTVDYKNTDEENYSFDSVTDALKLDTLNEDVENHEDTETEDGFDFLSDDYIALDDDISQNDTEYTEEDDDENAVDIESELDYESAMEKNTLTTNNYYSGASWIKILKEDENFRYHPFIRAKMNARKVRLKRDFAKGKLLLPGEVRYLSRDLLLLLKYLLDLVYVQNTTNNPAANEKLKDGIRFVHGYLLEKDSFYAPTRQNPLKAEPEGIPYKNGAYYPLFRNPHLSRNEQVALRCLCNTNYTIREKYLGHLTGVIMVSGESFVPKTLGGADFDGDLVKIFDDPIVLKAVQRGICNEDERLPIININDKPDKDTENNQSENEKNIELPTQYRNEIDYRVLYNTFANSIGQISNIAINKGQQLFTSDFDSNISKCSLYTILTGLEIDACKTGLHPCLPAANTGLESKKNDSSSFSISPEDFSYIDHLIKPLKNLNKGYPTLPSKESIVCDSENGELSWSYKERGKNIKINLKDPSSKDYKSLSYLAYLFLYSHKNDTLPGLKYTSEKKVKNGTFSSTFPISENNESVLKSCIEKYITIKNLSEKNKKQYYRSIYYVLNRQQIEGPDIRHIAEELRKLLPTKIHATKHPLEAELDTAYDIYLELQESDWPYLYGNEIEEEFRRLFRLNEEPIPAAISCLLDFRAKGYQLLNLFLSYVMCIIKDDIKENNKQTDLAAFFAKKCKAELKKELKEDPFLYLYTISNDKSSNLYKNYGNGKLDLIWLCYSADEIREKIKSKYIGYGNIDIP